MNDDTMPDVIYVEPVDEWSFYDDDNPDAKMGLGEYRTIDAETYDEQYRASPKRVRTPYHHDREMEKERKRANNAKSEVQRLQAAIKKAKSIIWRYRYAHSPVVVQDADAWLKENSNEQ